MLVLGSEQYFPRDMGTPAPAATKSPLEGALVGKGSSGEGSHCGQGTESFLEEASVGEHAFGS